MAFSDRHARRDHAEVRRGSFMAGHRPTRGGPGGSAGATADNSVDIRVAARLENLATIRTLVAALAIFEDLDGDAVADLRLAADEACTTLIRSAVAGTTLRLVVEPRQDAVVIRVSATCRGTGGTEPPNSFSWHVLTSLTR